MRKKISIMLIDDNRIDLFIHGEFIKQINIASEMLEYTSASEALLFLTNNKLESWPDLILLDIHMPIMNGFDFLEKFNVFKPEKKNKCKIIIVSSSLNLDDKSKATNNELVIELLEKPLNTDKLLSVLAKYSLI